MAKKFDKFHWWNPADWGGQHDEQSRFKTKERNDEDYKKIMEFAGEKNQGYSNDIYDRNKKFREEQDYEFDQEIADLEEELESNRIDLLQEERKKDKIAERRRIENDPNLTGEERDKKTKELNEKHEVLNERDKIKSYDQSKINQFKSKFPQYIPMMRIQEKAIRGEDLSPQEAKILRQSRQRLSLDMAKEDFLDKILGFFGGDKELQAEFVGFLNHSPKFLIQREDGSRVFDTPMTVEEQAIADTDKNYEDYIKDLDDSDEKHEEANKYLEESYEEKLEEREDFERDRKDVSKFYEDRLGISDDLADKSIQTSEDYAASPSIASETIRNTIDKQLKNRVSAYDSTNQRFGSGANIDKLHRDISDKDQRFANEAAILKMQEEQGKQKYLANALMVGARDKQSIGDGARKRELLDDKIRISQLPDEARRLAAGSKINEAGRSTDNAATRFALENARQNIGVDNYESYLNRLSHEQDKTSDRNWQLGAGVLNTAGSLASKGLVSLGFGEKKKKEKELESKSSKDNHKE